MKNAGYHALHSLFNTVLCSCMKLDFRFVPHGTTLNLASFCYPFNEKNLNYLN
ncbi:hypothetical protein HMPREF3226_02405 [Prevotella corporis]|uniref:Uncharacterized protein n=1 Tax=Prevotella corporis TaxID=28128 RepID=A0A133PVV5_9BACT|nr:hypothetical protein HMPREF3226_02405 [Prevotella corporis]